MPIRRIVVAVLALLSVRATAQRRPLPPNLGTSVLEEMRAAYAGRWYSTLTFTQKTTLHRPAGTVEQTWYESLRHTPEHGTQLRIDIGDPAAGNGTLYTADSAWIVRGGAVTAIRAHGNEFLPLIEGVYMQPVDRTVRELAPMNVDLTKVRAAKWRARPAWVVGASEASDSTSPQFWIDVERKVVVRIILHADAQSPLIDVDLGGYERLAGGWLATRILIKINGTLAQEEVYRDWKANIPLPDSLFDPARWKQGNGSDNDEAGFSTARHR